MEFFEYVRLAWSLWWPAFTFSACFFAVICACCALGGNES